MRRTPGNAAAVQRRSGAVVLALALAAGACGSQLDHEAIVAAHEGSRARSPGAGSPVPAQPGSEATPPAGDLGAAPDAGGPDASAAGTATDAAGVGAAVGSAPSAPAAGRAAAGGPVAAPTGAGRAGGNQPAGAGGVRSPGTPTTRAAASTGPSAGSPVPKPPGVPSRSTVVVGSVGNYSGPAGNSQAPGAAALQVFARYVNDRGGVAGHPVKVIVVDDGGDPARHQAAVKDLVDNHGVLAFVANLASLTASSARTYLEQRQVPVIGGEVSTPIWFDSPMFFPQGPNYRSLVRGMAVAGKRLGGGRTKVGALTCQEAEVCNNVDRWLFDEGFAKQAGLQPVYRGRISLTQPDFTAECLSARNAGVELLNVTGDPNTVGRVAASCDRQGYHPIFLQHSATVDNGTVNAAGGKFEALLVTLTFPWVANGTPALDEYQAAMQLYKTSPSAATSMGWASAKLFARAAAGLGEPPNRAQLLDGLYALKNETLGGLTVPLNFRRGQPAVDSGCWFVLRAGEGRWQAPQGATPDCP